MDPSPSRPPLDRPPEAGAERAAVLLAFDTSTELLSVAVQDAGGARFLHEEAGGARASAVLLPAILALLKRAGVSLGALDAIAFGRGPGAFTGLRTACAVAQGLAFGAGKPVLPIDTLLAVAEDARAGDLAPARTWALLDARMDEVYAAQYRFDGMAWSVVDAPRLTTPEQLALHWRGEPPERLAGNALNLHAARLAPRSEARLYPEARPSASALPTLAAAAWHRGEAHDAALALPLYLRDKVAQTTAERLAARAAKDAASAAAGTALR